MKYLIILCILFAFTSSLATIPQTMTPVMLVEVGVGTDEELEVEGYDLIENNVEWNVPGEYEVVYYNRLEPSYVHRTVIIATAQAFDEGIVHYQEQRLNQESAIYHVRDAIFESEDSYFVIGTVESEDSIEQTILLQEYAFIAYYQHHVQVFCHRFDQSYSYLCGAQASDAGLTYFLTYTNEDNTDLQIGEITRTGMIIRQNDFGGSGNEQGFKCFLDQGQLTLFFTSTSQDGPWGPHEGTGSILVALQIDWVNWSIKRMYQFGNNQSNRFIDADVVNDHFYLYIDVKGEGDFFNANPNHHQTLGLVMNLDLSIELSQPINVIAGTVRMVCSTQEIYFWTMQMSTTSAKFILKTYDLGFRLEQTLEQPLSSSNMRITAINAATNEDGTTLLFYNQSVNEENTFGGAFEIRGREIKNWPYQHTLEQGVGIYAYGHWRIIGSVEDGLVYAELTCCETLLYQMHTDLYYVLPEKHVIVNGVTFGRIGLAPLEITDYGYYEELTRFSSSNAVVILKNTFYIPLITNICDQEQYDCGMRIHFNGTGYLNDEPFSSGSVLSQEGTYQLVIIGTGALRKMINFQIKDMTPLYPPTSVIDSPLLQDYSELASPITPLFAIVEGNLERLETMDWGWMIVGMLTLTGALFGLWVRFPKRFHR